MFPENYWNQRQSPNFPASRSAANRQDLLRALAKAFVKKAMGGLPPGGGMMPPGMPPAPPMDPSMMGGGGGMPPGGMPPMDPMMGGMPPMDPMLMGGLPPGAAPPPPLPPLDPALLASLGGGAPPPDGGEGAAPGGGTPAKDELRTLIREELASAGLNPPGTSSSSKKANKPDLNTIALDVYQIKKMLLHMMRVQGIDLPDEVLDGPGRDLPPGGGVSAEPNTGRGGGESDAGVNPIKPIEPNLSGSIPKQASANIENIRRVAALFRRLAQSSDD